MSVLLLQRPFRSSKSKDQSMCLERRMLTWQKGNIRNLLEEGRALQSHLPKSYPSNRDNPNNLARTFSKFMFQGKTNAALQLLSQQGTGGGIFRADDVVDLGENTQKTVMEILRSKLPPTQLVSRDALLDGIADPPEVPPVIFDQISGSSIRCTASRTKGAASSSGIDAHG